MSPKTIIRCLSLTVLSAFLFATNASADRLDDILSDGEIRCGIMLDVPPSRHAGQ